MAAQGACKAGATPPSRLARPLLDSPPMRRPTTLVVDDESLIRWSLGQALEAAGFDVLEAEDGAHARPLLQRKVDVVLFDLRLPDTTGLELLRESKAAAPDRPVILMTAYRTPGISEEALAAGVSRIVDKPFEVHDMVDIALDLAGRPREPV
jgi:DNA-binding NtrC family response regulator